MDMLRHDNHKAYLVPYPIDSFVKPILIAADRTFIGRNPDEGIHIQIADKRVSRKHACIHLEDSRFSIEDLNSQNGTFVNDERIKKTFLNNHDKITIGKLTYLFLLQPHSAGEPIETAIETTDTLPFSLEEMNLSDIWAQSADRATQGFLDQGGDSDSESTPPDPLAHTRLSLLYQLSERLRSAGKIQDVYEQGMELFMKAIPAAEYALVAKRSVAGDSFQIVSCRLEEKSPFEGEAIPVSHTVFDWVLTQKVTLVSQNLSADERFQDSESIQVNDLRSILCVPITGKNNVIGLLYAQSNDLLNPFTKEDAIFASAVANEMALNIDNIHLQEKLRENERMAAIGLTVSNLAHNMKNLMAINQGTTQLMDIHIKERDFPQIQKKWHRVQNSLAGISRLSNDMLEFAKEDALYLKSVDVNKMIRGSRQLFEDSLSEGGLKFEYVLSPENPVWSVDKVLLQRALFNLILNAADAVQGKKNGRIRISTSVRQDRKLLISVEDNGCGIPKDKQGKVLELFFTTKGSEGTGLGLPMVYKFLEKSGGRLTFKSIEGKGSIFKMIFPAKTSYRSKPQSA